MQLADLRLQLKLHGLLLQPWSRLQEVRILSIQIHVHQPEQKWVLRRLVLVPWLDKPMQLADRVLLFWRWITVQRQLLGLRSNSMSLSSRDAAVPAALLHVGLRCRRMRRDVALQALLVDKLWSKDWDPVVLGLYPTHVALHRLHH